MASVISASTTSATALNMSADTTGVLQLATGATPTTAVTIDTSQNVGIGTTSPSYKLQISTTLPTGVAIETLNSSSFVSNGIAFRSLGNQAGISGITYAKQIFAGGSPDVMEIYNGANYPLVFGTNATERMRIDSSGNLLIGSTTSTGKLRIKQSADAYSGAIILENFGNTNYWGFQIGSDNNLYYGYNNTSRGVFNNSTGAYTTISDERLKENVINYTNALDKVNLLRPVTYNFIDDKNKYNQIGLIAQEVLNVIPEIVAKPANEDGYYGLNYAGLTPILVKAIQEQQTIINDLKARVTALEAK